MKSADEIKKALECCNDLNGHDCNDCPYRDNPISKYCKTERNADALALIQQLERENHDLLEERELNDFLRDKVKQLEGLLDHMNQLRDAAAGRALKMEERVHQLEAERDAAVELIPRACAYCEWYGTKHGGFFPDCKNPNGCRSISGINTGWQWRGVQKEE